jgi:broad specificity phosphatase PhoE
VPRRWDLRLILLKVRSGYRDDVDLGNVTRLYCVRHGESEANRLRVFSNRELAHGLTDVGRAQVHALADRLSGVAFDAFYASPILRARESAEILSTRLAIAFEVTAALAEYDVGELEGRSDEHSWHRYDELHSAWVRDGALDARHPGGESYNDVCARFGSLVARLRQLPPSASVLLVGHGGTFYCALSHFCTNVSPSFAFTRGIGHADVVIVDLAPEAMTCVSWAGSTP